MSSSTTSTAASLATKETELRRVIRNLEAVIVGFSGGADSALLAWIANDELGSNARAVTAVSPSLATTERDEAAQLARDWGLSWVEVETHEMANAAYRVNDGDRCAHCKDALMDAIEPLHAARSEVGRNEVGRSEIGSAEAVVVLGVNTDDLGDHRPGQAAAAQRGARFPFVEAGLSKADVRELSQQLGLSTWDKPAAACLASRLPYGTPVTMGRLQSIDRAEGALRALGFNDLRVRDYDTTARIEVPVELLSQLVDRRVEVIEAVKAAGYAYVTLDLEGLRSGNLNAVLNGDGRLPR